MSWSSYTWYSTKDPCSPYYTCLFNWFDIHSFCDVSDVIFHSMLDGAKCSNHNGYYLYFHFPHPLYLYFKILIFTFLFNFFAQYVLITRYSHIYQLESWIHFTFDYIIWSVRFYLSICLYCHVPKHCMCFSISYSVRLVFIITIIIINVSIINTVAITVTDVAGIRAGITTITYSLNLLLLLTFSSSITVFHSMHPTSRFLNAWNHSLLTTALTPS